MIVKSSILQEEALKVLQIWQFPWMGLFKNLYVSLLLRFAQLQVKTIPPDCH